MRTFLWAVLLSMILLDMGLAFSYGGESSSATPAPPPSAETWKDSQSGLTWQMKSTGGEMPWADAKAHCKSMSLGGRNDWRLPTITELRSLIRGCPATQKDGACGVTDSCLKQSCWNDPCKGCSKNGGPGPGGVYWPPELSGEAGWYWSASPVPEDSDGAWDVHFEVGGVQEGYIPGRNFVRCVR